MASNLDIIKSVVRKNIVAVIFISVAIISAFIIKPDKEYLNYFDFKTLSCLFFMLAIVCAFKNIHFFKIVARKIVSLFKTTRSAILALVYITFIGSMLITNDMALITFLPLAYHVLNATNQKRFMTFTFVMQSIAANLGGMLTPFGNPQNLYIYSFFDISNLEFIKIMFLPFIVSFIVITICCLFVKKIPLVIPEVLDEKLCAKKTLIYTILFALAIIIIFRVIPYGYGLLIIPFSLLILDNKALKDIDYLLLLTFCAFFVFSGNVSRIPSVSIFLKGIMAENTLLTGIVSSQFISNVPAAILLSRFTTDYQALLVSVNIGGVGTLIASLASLITYGEYVKHNPSKQWQFIKIFSIYNFGFLMILTMICLMW